MVIDENILEPLLHFTDNGFKSLHLDTPYILKEQVQRTQIECEPSILSNVEDELSHIAWFADSSMMKKRRWIDL